MCLYVCLFVNKHHMLNIAFNVIVNHLKCCFHAVMINHVETNSVPGWQICVINVMLIYWLISYELE